MEEIIRYTFKSIPEYLINFLKLLGAPRQFPLDKLPRDVNDMQISVRDALKFILISFSLIVILNLGKNDSKNVFEDLAATSISILMQMFLLVFAIFLGWKIFGSKRQFLEYFIIYSYNFSVTFIIISVFSLISSGYLKIFNRELYDNLLKVNSQKIKFNLDWFNNPHYQISLGIFIVGFLLGGIWGMISWGAYRMMNESKKGKSLIVMFVSGIFSWIAIIISLLITKAVER